MDRVMRPVLKAEAISIGKPPVLLTGKQVALLLAISPRQVHRIGLPRVVISPRVIRYRMEDVNGLIEEACTAD